MEYKRSSGSCQSFPLFSINSHWIVLPVFFFNVSYDINTNAIRFISFQRGIDFSNLLLLIRGIGTLRILPNYTESVADNISTDVAT